MERQQEHRRTRPASISRYQMVMIFAVIIVFIVSLSLLSYLEAKENLIQKNQEMQNETERHIIHTLTLLDRGHELFDVTLDTKMETAFQPFVAAYGEAGGDPSKIDLFALKTRLGDLTGGEIDLYVINGDGVIEYTTLEKDMGLDFRQWPEVYDHITAVRLGENFSADRVVQGFKPTGEFRKFAYMPTPDHRYLLELGLVSDSYKEQRREFSHLNAVKELERLNPNLVSIRLFDSTGRLLKTDEVTSYEPDAATRALIAQVHEDGRTREIPDPRNETYTRYIYADIVHSDYVSSSMMNLVAQITYSNQRQNDELRSLLFSQLLITFLAVMMGLVLAYTTSRFISRPIRDIVEDIDIIAQGDLNHSIRGTRGFEFDQLENAINILVRRLKANIETIRQSKQEIEHYTEELEAMVLRRTEEVQEGDREANLYLDLLTCNIQHLTSDILALLGMLAEIPPDGASEIVARAQLKARECIGTLRTISTIRRIYTGRLPMKPVSLDQTIRQVIRGFTGFSLFYSGKKGDVCADELLPDLFSNLIRFRFDQGGAETEIWLYTRDTGDGMEVTLEDNGPPVPGAIWEETAPGSWRHGMHLHTDELSLFVVRSLVERYGGEIHPDEGEEPTQGVRITIRLKRAK